MYIYANILYNYTLKHFRS